MCIEKSYFKGGTKLPFLLSCADSPRTENMKLLLLAKVLLMLCLYVSVGNIMVVSNLWALDKIIPTTKEQIQLSFAPLVKRVAPAVVNIHTSRVVEVKRSPLFADPFFRRFFGDAFAPGLRRREKQRNSLGSGVILSNDGLIITNHHVISGAEEIIVALADRREFLAELILDDKETDLAVLRINSKGEKLPFLVLRNSDDVEVGDLVLAIGNPFNVGQTVTSGIVSALARTRVGVSDFQFFIQTDAAINPGNSGGALITMDGRLVGVNTAIYSGTGGSHGIGFAVPSKMVKAVLESAASGLTRVRRPWFGASAQAITVDLASSIGLTKPVGVLVSDIYVKGPADRAGIIVGDVILSIDGQQIESPRALKFQLGTRSLGGISRIDVWRGGKVLTLSVKLEAAPEKPARNATILKGRNPLSGATIGNISPALAEELRLDTMLKGVVILEVARGSPSDRIGIREGDRILRLDGHDVTRVTDLVENLAGNVAPWVITIQRGGKRTTLRIGG